LAFPLQAQLLQVPHEVLIRDDEHAEPAAWLAPSLRGRKRKSPAACWCARLGFLASFVPVGHGAPATASMDGIRRPKSPGLGIPCRMLAGVTACIVAAVANPVSQTPTLPGGTGLSLPPSSTPSMPGDWYLSKARLRVQPRNSSRAAGAL
jgi:hypothetical protein